MTALVDHSDLLRKLTGGDSGAGELIWAYKHKTLAAGTGITIAANKPFSYWTLSGSYDAGAAPGGTTRNPTNATTGAVPFTSPGGSRDKWLAAVSMSGFAGVAIFGMICDRLADISGLSGTSASLQSLSNFSTARFTGTSAVGNQIAIEVYASIGTTPRTLTVNYTNENGVAQVTTVTVGGAAAWPRATLSWIPVSLAAGDRGVRSVESVQLSGSTGTAGDFGVTIYRNVCPFGVSQNGVGGSGLDLMEGPDALKMVTNACLFMWTMSTSTTFGYIDLGLQFVES
jgi:hypothetical protein